MQIVVNSPISSHVKLFPATSSQFQQVPAIPEIFSKLQLGLARVVSRPGEVRGFSTNNVVTNVVINIVDYQ